MKLSSTVERRLLISWRADPEVVAPLLPAGLRPQTVAGSAVVGVCLIRLGGTRPRGWPRHCGFTSEGAAHRVGVEWETAAGPQSGVYIWQRHTSSALHVLVGGRLFPGTQARADFDVRESPSNLRVGVAGRDGSVIDVEAAVDGGFESEMFRDVDDASAYFEHASIGLSPGRDPSHLEGMQLHTHAWAVTPVTVRRATSSFFDDPDRFPPGSIELDSGLLMRMIPVTWQVADRVA